MTSFRSVVRRGHRTLTCLETISNEPDVATSLISTRSLPRFQRDGSAPSSESCRVPIRPSTFRENLDQLSLITE
ncbi:hypothetical protein EA462_13520 [Natrarchaeobius halalkaliphilus]|uniref:Uncharacterized protein n=1 Tax=Natrarchaeobius halalkaliphilus TaxID=1679091 RepID=A0A3N6LNV8_9EURY|nr:hypothetical protein EA462_13520 [Natrarchaeobius halalkaliphilus]